MVLVSKSEDPGIEQGTGKADWNENGGLESTEKVEVYVCSSSLLLWSEACVQKP